jgi:hypothetical protein
MDSAGKLVGVFSVASVVIRALNATRAKVPSLAHCMTSGVTERRAGCRDGVVAMRVSNWGIMMQTRELSVKAKKHAGSP